MQVDRRAVLRGLFATRAAPAAVAPALSRGAYRRRIALVLPYAVGDVIRDANITLK